MRPFKDWDLFSKVAFIACNVAWVIGCITGFPTP